MMNRRKILIRLTTGISFLMFCLALFVSDATTVHGATYAMQTGYYVGNGNELRVTNLGFTPDLVLIKPDTTASAVIWVTKEMIHNTSAYLGVATADVATGLLSIINNGFLVTSTANTANTRYTWIAFTGSDCSASGVFCVGGYYGNGSGNKTITTGFDPGLAWIKPATNADGGTWRTPDMSANNAQFFAALIQNTTGGYFTGIGSGAFITGTTTNVNNRYYHYVAFKEVAGSTDFGTYTGNATDNRSITGVGFTPDFVFVKNAGSALSAMLNTTESYGDNSSYFTATANLVNAVQALESDGFQVGTNGTTNNSGSTIYYSAFTGASDLASTTGSFLMANGTYTGTQQPMFFNNLEFAPDMVIIKSDHTDQAVFRTSLMAGDTTPYMAANTTNFASGITNLGSNGFSIGTSTVVNRSGVVHHWTAFGNAWKPHNRNGAEDFLIGAYYGSGIDNRNITRLPFAPNMVVIKAHAQAYNGVLKTTAMAGDTTASFSNLAPSTPNYIQSIGSNGFQVGTGSRNVNYSAYLYNFFTFKEGAGKFDVGSYVGDGTDNRNITDPGFQPDLVWLIGDYVTDPYTVSRSSTIDSDLDRTHYFVNTASTSNIIQSLITTGFQVGNNTESNPEAGIYYYSTWKKPSAQADPILNQPHFRWLKDDNSINNASFAVAEDTAISSGIVPGDRLRLRFVIANTGGSATNYNYRLEYASTTCSDWTPVTTHGSITGEHWSMDFSPYSGNMASTSDSAGLTNPDGLTFAPGYLMTSGYQTPAYTLAGNYFTELEYSIRSTIESRTEVLYCFRLTNAGSASYFTHTSQPQITLSRVAQRKSDGGVSVDANGTGQIIVGGSARGSRGSGNSGDDGTGEGPPVGGGGGGGGGGLE